MAKRSPQALRVLITAWVAVLVLTSFILTNIVQAFLRVVLHFASWRTRTMWMGGAFRKISVMVTAWNPFWRIRRINKLPVSYPGNTLVMCNHLSNLDPFVMCNVLFPWEMKFVAKADLFSIPFGGWAMNMAGDIPIYFTSEKGGWGIKKGETAKMFARCRELLTNRVPIMAFPEGARSKTGELQPFKNGMFQVAIDSKSSIIPMALAGTENAWPFGDLLFDKADISCVMGEPIHIQEGETVDALRERVQQVIAELQKQLPSTKVEPRILPATEENKPKAA